MLVQEMPPELQLHLVQPNDVLQVDPRHPQPLFHHRLLHARMVEVDVHPAPVSAGWAANNQIGLSSRNQFHGANTMIRTSEVPGLLPWASPEVKGPSWEHPKVWLQGSRGSDPRLGVHLGHRGPHLPRSRTSCEEGSCQVDGALALVRVAQRGSNHPLQVQHLLSHVVRAVVQHQWLAK